MNHGLPDTVTKDEKKILKALPSDGSRLGIEYVVASTRSSHRSLAKDLERKNLVARTRNDGEDGYQRMNLRLTDRGQKYITTHA